ncbi:MAG: hypothetical protein AB7T38_17565 [Nitrospirales bacterium]
MIRFKKIAKTVLTILAVVPFSLIGILVVAMVSKPGLKEVQLEREQHHEVNNAAPSPNMITDGSPPVVIESPQISRLSQPGCLDVGKRCETPTRQRVGVWGETVLKRSPS